MRCGYQRCENRAWAAASHHRRPAWSESGVRGEFSPAMSGTSGGKSCMTWSAQDVAADRLHRFSPEPTMGTAVLETHPYLGSRNMTTDSTAGNEEQEMPPSPERLMTDRSMS